MRLGESEDDLHHVAPLMPHASCPPGGNSVVRQTLYTIIITKVLPKVLPYLLLTYSTVCNSAICNLQSAICASVDYSPSLPLR